MTSIITGGIDAIKDAAEFGVKALKDIPEIILNTTKIEAKLISMLGFFQSYFGPVLNSSTLLITISVGLLFFVGFCSLILFISLGYTFIKIQTNYKDISKNADILYKIYGPKN